MESELNKAKGHEGDLLKWKGTEQTSPENKGGFCTHSASLSLSLSIPSLSRPLHTTPPPPPSTNSQNSHSHTVLQSNQYMQLDVCIGYVAQYNLIYFYIYSVFIVSHIHSLPHTYIIRSSCFLHPAVAALLFAAAAAATCRPPIFI